MNTIKFAAEELYNKELKEIHKKLGKGITYGSELAKLAHKMFGNKFKGVYAANEIKDLKNLDEGYFIFNLDKRDEPGSHWIGIVKSKIKNSDKPKFSILVYDSFGRDTKEIIPNVYSLGNIKDTENDAEQLIWMSDCGSRVISFLKIYDEYGPEIASLI